MLCYTAWQLTLLISIIGVLKQSQRSEMHTETQYISAANQNAILVNPLARWFTSVFFRVTEKWHIQFNSFRKGVTAWLEWTNGTKIIIRFFFLFLHKKHCKSSNLSLFLNFLSIEFRYRWSLSHTKKSEHNFAYARLAWFMHLKWILFHIFPYLYY